MFKKILLTILSFVFTYNVYKLIVLFFELSPEKLSLLAIIVSALAFNLLTTGIVAFLGFAYPLSEVFHQTIKSERYSSVCDLELI